jgi:hypothetical protein
MDKEMRKNEDVIPIKVYKQKGMLYWGLVFIIVIIGIHFMVIASPLVEDSMTTWIINGFVMLLYSSFFFTLFVLAGRTSLAIYEEGIEWRRGGSSMFATWDNLSHIGAKNEGDATTHGIFLHRQIESKVNSWVDKHFFALSGDYIRLTGFVKVPINFKGLLKGSEIDFDEFAKTEFGQDLLHYAPHLFEKSESL